MVDNVSRLAAVTGDIEERAVLAAEGSTAQQPLNMNVVLFITDQQRYTQLFPEGWDEQNLPGMTRLKAHGLSFDYAITNACMCSPARSTLLTGYFPAQHGVKYTLEENMPSDQYPQVELPLDLPNIASVMSAAGYNVVYKGKWHCSKPANGMSFEPSDVGQYGFQRWDPPDAGQNQNPDFAGGGTADNDGRFMNDNGDWEDGLEGVLAFLNDEAVAEQPFFLIVSLVNPHDVLSYPKAWDTTFGYDPNAGWLDGTIQAPPNGDPDLPTKPTAQQQFWLYSNAGFGPLPTDQLRANYLNFYGNLMISSDNYLVQILDTLEDLNLFDDTLIIQTSDHGEGGMSHGLRQKNFNFYEETLRVPMIYSNPQLFPTPRTSSAMVSHVDFLPTIASLFGAPEWARADWQGVDYSRLILNAYQFQWPVQNYLVFTFDDFQSGQPDPPYPDPPNHICSIRGTRFKLAEYYDVNGQVASQYEMYDLQNDPLEEDNLAYNLESRSWWVQFVFQALLKKLNWVKENRLQPLPSTPGGDDGEG